MAQSARNFFLFSLIKSGTFFPSGLTSYTFFSAQPSGPTALVKKKKKKSRARGEPAEIG